MYRQTALNKNHKRLENKLKIVRQRQQTAATAFYLSKYMKFVERNEQSTVFWACVCVLNTFDAGYRWRNSRDAKSEIRTHLVDRIWPKIVWLSIQYRVRSLK